MMTEAALKGSSCKPRNTKDCQQQWQQLGEGKEGSSPAGVRGSRTLETTLNLDCEPPDLETTNFSCFKPHVLWYVVVAALGNYIFTF